MSSTSTSITGTGESGAGDTSSGGGAGLPEGEGVKFHPGTYAWSPSYRQITDPAVLQMHLDFIDSICANDDITGVSIASEWAGLEGPTKGDYSAGFTALDTILDRAARCNKRIMLSMTSLHFGTWDPSNPSYHLPPYLICNEVPNPESGCEGNPYGTTLLTGYGQVRGFTARIWQDATMNAFVDMIGAYGARYDQNPTLEMVAFGETALNIENEADGYSVDVLESHLRTMLQGARAAFPHTQIRMPTNDLWPDDRMASLLDFMKALYVVPGGPDVRRDDVTQADRIYVGLDEFGHGTFPDLRAHMPWVMEVQDPELAIWSAADLHDASMNGYTATHSQYKDPDTGEYDAGFYVMPTTQPVWVIWVAQQYTCPNPNDPAVCGASEWSPGILSLIASTHGRNFYGSAADTPCFDMFPACDRR